MSTLSLNVGNFVTLRLTPSNYPLWREQALALAESQEMVGHLTNEDPPPKQFTDDETPQLSETFKSWRKTDRLLRGWIIGTLSEEALGLIVEREFTLRQQITYLRKEDNTTITEHIRTFKGIYDNLSAIGKTIPDQEKVFCLLTSLGPHYETFTTTMLKPPRPSYTELISQLQSLDQRRNWFSNQSDITAPSPTHQLAFYGQHQ
ncbi:Retrovirus-related polyprotein from transposon [Salix suchowensis]|nr:Retrovirus-related polyprotein from transposon [Salix suchowensis]